MLCDLRGDIFERLTYELSLIDFTSQIMYNVTNYPA